MLAGACGVKRGKKQKNLDLMGFILVLAIIALLAVLDFLRKYYFPKLRLSQDVPFPFLGHVSVLVDLPHINVAFEEMSKRHGDVFQVNLLGNVFAVIRGVENNKATLLAKRARDEVSTEALSAVASGLFKEPLGKRHQELRKIFAPFLMNNDYQEVIQQILGKHVERLSNFLKVAARDKKVLDMDVEFRRFVFDAMTELVCGIEMDSSKDKKYVEAWDTVLEWSSWMVQVQNTAYWKIVGNTKARQRFLEAQDVIRGLVRESLNRLRQQDQSAQEGPTCLFGHYLQSGDESLTLEEAVDFAINFVWGAHDSTRFTLAMAVVEASRHPDAAAAVRAEMRRNMLPDQLYPSVDQVSKETAPNLNAFVSELLRIYPAFPLISSKLEEDVVLSNGVLLPAQTTLFQLLGADQTDPREWGADAKEFRPSRWLPLLEAGTPEPKAFLAFGAGVRTCIGKKLALMDVRLFVGVLLKDFDFQLKQEVKTVVEVSFKTLGVHCTVSVPEK